MCVCDCVFCRSSYRQLATDADAHTDPHNLWSLSTVRPLDRSPVDGASETDRAAAHTDRVQCGPSHHLDRVLSDAILYRPVWTVHVDVLW